MKGWERGENGTWIDNLMIRGDETQRKGERKTQAQGEIQM